MLIKRSLIEKSVRQDGKVMATFTGYDDAFEDDLNDCRHMVLEENEWLRNQEARVKVSPFFLS